MPRNTVALIYSPYEVQNITLHWGKAINYILSSPDCAPDLILAPVSITSLSNFCLMPADLLTCPKTAAVCQRTNRPVGLSKREREGAIERKRWGSQLRLGNGRLNTSGCVCRAYVCSRKRRTSLRAAVSALAVHVCALPVASHIAKLNLAGSGF